MELGNDIVYTTPSGSFLTEGNSSLQDIKYPRDVFRDRAGTCIDLAITYAALAESVWSARQPYGCAGDIHSRSSDCRMAVAASRTLD